MMKTSSTPTHNIPHLIFRNFPFHMWRDEMARVQYVGLLLSLTPVIQITFLSWAGGDLILDVPTVCNNTSRLGQHCSCWKVDVDYKNIWSTGPLVHWANYRWWWWWWWSGTESQAAPAQTGIVKGGCWSHYTPASQFSISGGMNINYNICVTTHMYHVHMYVNCDS